MKVNLILEGGKIKKVINCFGYQSSGKGMPQAGEEIHGLDQGASGEITLDLVRAGNGFLVVKKETVAQLLPDHKKRPSHLRRR